MISAIVVIASEVLRKVTDRRLEADTTVVDDEVEVSVA